MKHAYAFWLETVLRKAWIPALIFSVALGAASCGSSGNNPAGPGGGGSKELNSGNIAPGASYSHVFTKSGSYAYHCIYHSVMTGTVTVSGAAVDSLVQVNIASSSAPFPTATVKTGGKVTWKNNTGMTHTVTSN